MIILRMAFFFYLCPTYSTLEFFLQTMACIIEKAAEKYMHLCMHNMMYMTYIYSIYIIYQYLGGGGV